MCYLFDEMGNVRLGQYSKGVICQRCEIILTEYIVIPKCPIIDYEMGNRLRVDYPQILDTNHVYLYGYIHIISYML